VDTAASRALVLDYFRALGKNDERALERILADDIEWLPPASAPIPGGPWRGRDYVRRAMTEAGARFFRMETTRTEILKIAADGDSVFVRYRMACTATNGRAYQNEYVWLFTCANGQIARMEEHTDSLHFYRVVIEG
jgi:ketosteroid isomerase-like protein